jgi:hypothetical protein
MKANVIVHEACNLPGLSRAIIAQATRDLRAPSRIKRLDALFWLTGDDFQVWADAMDMPYLDPFKMLSSGRLRKQRTTRLESVMSDELDLVKLFEGLEPSKVKALAGRIQSAVQEAINDFEFEELILKLKNSEGHEKGTNER